ncbi:peptidase M48 Ste24p [Thermocrinis albus DSM 14484]|uniref:Peptidase M48 Ste24p n=1 Tax=Thermocrinis albus (strain DSM 14484 / JCM 11386 / HI 11/12) TaxID=638303 RepID=D3SP82_THEAH|nr:M48 family metalloprotease [Thermocrinis albus]ADC88969.1 peptidase M48 Ste24p [Thermocrinis albus DSM 14484]
MRALLSFILLFLFSCAQVSSSFTLLPEEEEIRIGKAYVPLAIEEMDGLYPDPQVQRYVSEVGMRLARHTERNLPYSFYVVNSDQVNAFALPGGPIMITRGLLMRLEKESELAGVLGHELGHLNARHHARFMEKMVAMNLLLQIGSVFLQDKAYGPLLVRFGEIGAQLMSLKFSRDQEREADRYGVIYAIRAGYDPNGLIGTFRILEKVGGDERVEWLSTHPLPKTRIEETKDLIRSLRPSGTLVDDTEEFQKIKRSLLATKPSFDAFAEGKKYYQKGDLRTALLYMERAIRLYDRNYMARVYAGMILARMGRGKDALSYVERAYREMPQVFSTNYAYGYVLFITGDYPRSVNYLRRARDLIPSYPDTYYYLGRCYEAMGDSERAVENYRTALQLAGGERPWVYDAQERLRRCSRGC